MQPLSGPALWPRCSAPGARLLQSGSKELASTLKEVMEAFIQHMREEEDEMVPKLLAGMSGGFSGWGCW